VVFLENHDQVANTGLGKRLHQRTSPGRLRALTALTLLSPAPMLFQGQEWASSKPFLYFTDHRPELQAMVDEGRAELMSQFESLAVPLDPPGDPRTFERCKLDWSEKNPEVYALHKHLLALRRPGPVEGAVLGDRAFVLRWSERALVVNLGADLDLDVLPEPLLAAPGGWRLLWSSEDPRYGGSGTPPIEDEEGRLHVLGESAVLLEGGEP
jgi:maltooligosyltrehalose trehalohydrolase